MITPQVTAAIEEHRILECEYDLVRNELREMPEDMPMSDPIFCGLFIREMVLRQSIKFLTNIIANDPPPSHTFKTAIYNPDL